MFTPSEARALLFLSVTAALGVGVKAVRAGEGGPPGAALIAPDLKPGDLAAQESSTARAIRAARPLEPGETVDLDRADALEIERLPRIGPQLARRIVDERASGGLFGSLAGLSRVSGVGPAILEGLARRVTFSGRPDTGLEDLQQPQSRTARPRLQGRAATPGEQGMGPAIATMPPPPPPERIGGFTFAAPRARRAPAGRPPAQGVICPAPPISLNEASAAELTCLPGIGPGLAQRIVTWRTAHGPFAEAKDLQRVPGIGSVRFQRLIPYVRAP